MDVIGEYLKYYLVCFTRVRYRKTNESDRMPIEYSKK